MPYAPSKVQQQTAIGEGLAIACLALGVDEVPNNKLDLEFAFRHAWRAWPHRQKFPHVSANLERTDVLRILGDADGRRSAFVATWTTDYRAWFPDVKQDGWGWEELADNAGSNFGVDLHGWLAIAGPWLKHMGVAATQK